MLVVEFSCNNNFQDTIHIAPYDALYGWKCSTQIYWFKIRIVEFLVHDLVQQVIEEVKINGDWL